MMIPGPGGEHAGVYVGDNRELVKQMADQSVHCIVTSPPYWGLRDYGTAMWVGGDPNCEHVVGNQVADNKADGAITAGVRPGCDASTCPKCGARRIDAQLGLEPTPGEYVDNLVALAREWWRVLRDDGTLWLNLGTSYAGSGGAGGDYNEGGLRAGQPRWKNNYRAGSGRADGVVDGRGQRNRDGIGGVPGFKPKDLIPTPWMVAMALQANGWYLRSDIIWHKPNPMPESVTDRPTKSHEYIFLLTKRPRYYYDAEAVRGPVKQSSIERAQYGLNATHSGFARDARTGSGWERCRNGETMAEAGMVDPAGRNLRSVWTVTTKPFKGSHFATFPPDLIEPCIKAGTSERGVCPACGAPWARVVEKHSRCDVVRGSVPSSYRALGQPQQAGVSVQSTTLGWRPTCDCDAGEPIGAIVYDPFGGAGTTGLVSFRLGRRYILHELNPKYAVMARDRIIGDAPLLAGVTK